MQQIDQRGELSARRRGRLGRADWVRAALEVLSHEGVDAVTIGRLCRHLGVTKGSFYWHFKSRDVLLAAMADSWADKRIQGAIDAARASHPSGFSRLLEFIQSSMAGATRRDRAMRAWATHDRVAAGAVARADGRILEFVAESLMAEGASMERAADLAKLLLFAGIGFFSKPPAGDPGELERLAQCALELLQGGIRGPSPR